MVIKSLHPGGPANGGEGEVQVSAAQLAKVPAFVLQLFALREEDANTNKGNIKRSNTIRMFLGAIRVFKQCFGCKNGDKYAGNQIATAKKSTA